MRLANLWTIKWTNTCNNLEVFFLSLLLFCFLFFFFLPDFSCISPCPDVAVLLTLSRPPRFRVTIMGKSESQMDIVEKSTKSGKKPWSFVAIGLAVLLLLMTCAAVALVILYASSRGKNLGIILPFPLQTAGKVLFLLS